MNILILGDNIKKFIIINYINKASSYDNIHKYFKI